MSIMDAVVFGIKGAFLNLKLPKLVVTNNVITGEDIIDLSDKHITSFKRFDTKGFPLICTIGEVENQLIVDLNGEECESVDSYYVVCFDEQNNLMGIRKFGDQPLRIENINKIVSLAFKFGVNVNQKFKNLSLS
jgi:exosome complex RNA-binding protein Rrp42 (RNase PH superfamily)